MIRLEQSQQGPRLERRTYISVESRSQSPFISTRQRRRILFPSALPIAHHPDSPSLTPTLTRLQPASDDAPQPMRFTLRAEPSSSFVVFFSLERNLLGSYYSRAVRTSCPRHHLSNNRRGASQKKRRRRRTRRGVRLFRIDAQK